MRGRTFARRGLRFHTTTLSNIVKCVAFAFSLYPPPLPLLLHSRFDNVVCLHNAPPNEPKLAVAAADCPDRAEYFQGLINCHRLPPIYRWHSISVTLTPTAATKTRNHKKLSSIVGLYLFYDACPERIHSGGMMHVELDSNLPRDSHTARAFAKHLR